MGDILTKIQTRFQCPFVPPSFLQANMLLLLLFVIAENCEIAKVSVFVIYLPKSAAVSTLMLP